VANAVKKTAQQTKYKGLLATRAKAMSVFTRALTKLRQAAAQCEAGTAECARRKDAASRAIAVEEENEKFLAAELEGIKATTAKIEDLLA
jgi:hypothetical protein